MTRLISGVAGGRRLKVPAHRRPPDRRPRPRGPLQLPQALLDLRGAAVLDLYAGSGRARAGGAVPRRGDRGLRRVRARACCRCSGRTSPPSASRAAGWSPVRCPPSSAAPPPARFDLVLADPPYATPVEEVQRRAPRRSPSGAGWPPMPSLVVERSSREEPFEWPTPLVGLRDRRYGEALLRYGRSS